MIFAALVLAAGASTRMAPDNKLLTRMADGEAMVACTVGNIIAAGIDPIIIVTGHKPDAIRAALAGQPVRIIHAADHAAGMAASLAAGIQALAATVDAVLICLADMPLVTPATLAILIAAFNPAEGREIILPTHGGQRGNPVLWSRRFFPALAALTGDTGGRQLLREHGDLIIEVPMESDAVLRDFDTPEALEAGRKEALLF